MNGYTLNLVTYFDNRGFTKHYDTNRPTFIGICKMKYKKVVRLQWSVEICSEIKRT